MLTYIQWGTKDFEFELNSAYNSGQEIKLYELNYALDSVNKAVSSWIQTHHGKEILNASTMGVFEVEAEHLVDLDQLCEFISSCSQMEFCFGVGVEAPHAKSACEYGLYHGDKISLYHDDMDIPEEEEDPLFKAEHPEAHGQLAQQQEDPTAVIMAGIKLLKEHSAKIEELKQASPEIYDTIRHISQAMVAMAKQMSEIKQAAMAESESIKKSEQLFKTDMSQEDSNKLGSHQGYANLAEQFNYLDHTKTNPIGNGFFHHTFEGAQGQIHSHTLSRSVDPRKPHLAQLHMALQDDGVPSVESIAVHPDYKGNGYGKSLYMNAVQHHGKIYSDTKMSPNAGKAWQHMASSGVNVSDGPEGRKMASLEKKLSFPAPLAALGAGASGAVHGKKIKTAVRDPESGQKKPARWRSVRSGMVMSQNGGVASSREPNVP